MFTENNPHLHWQSPPLSHHPGNSSTSGQGKILSSSLNRTTRCGITGKALQTGSGITRLALACAVFLKSASCSTQTWRVSVPSRQSCSTSPDLDSSNRHPVAGREPWSGWRWGLKAQPPTRPHVPCLGQAFSSPEITHPAFLTSP